MCRLTKKQLQAYERDGWLVIEDFASRAECEQLRQSKERSINKIGHARQTGGHKV